MNRILSNASRIPQSLMDNTLSYTTWMLNSMTRLYGLQCEAAKAALQLQQQRLEALLEAKQVSDVAGEPMRLFSSGMEHAMDAMRKSSALMQEMHAELLQLAHQSLSGFSQASQESAETALPPQKDVGTASKPKRRAS